MECRLHKGVLEDALGGRSFLGFSRRRREGQGGVVGMGADLRVAP